jgi:hypothetical protein
MILVSLVVLAMTLKKLNSVDTITAATNHEAANPVGMITAATNPLDTSPVGMITVGMITVATKIVVLWVLHLPVCLRIVAATIKDEVLLDIEQLLIEQSNCALLSTVEYL